MTTRTITAETLGPITIDATLLGCGGLITVRAEFGGEYASITIETADETGPSAEAIRAATLRHSGSGLYARVEGTNAGGGAVSMVASGNRGAVVQIGGTVTGSVTGMTISGRDVVINGHRISGDDGMTVVQGSSPVRITAVVPEGSSVLGRTQSAGIEVAGVIESVTAATQSGDVHIGQATRINTKTQSGDIRLDRTDVAQAISMSGDITIADFGGTAQLKTMSGDIHVHATTSGDITATTMSGDIDITTAHDGIGADLNMQTTTMTGHIHTPQPHNPDNPQRRR